MRMQQAMEKMISQMGSTMTLVHDGTEQSIRAFLQDTHSQSQESTQWAATPLGHLANGMYVYIGPASPAAESGDVVLFQGRRFELRRAEPVMLGDRVLYTWGLCVERSGDHTWGSGS